MLCEKLNKQESDLISHFVVIESAESLINTIITTAYEQPIDIRPYSKSKLELKSSAAKIFIGISIFLFVPKVRL